MAAAAGAIVALLRPSGDSKKGDAMTFGVRPEHITLDKGSGVKFGGSQRRSGRAVGRRHGTMLYTATKDRQPVTISVDGQQQAPLGSTITAYVDPSRYHVFAPDGRTI